MRRTATRLGRVTATLVAMVAIGVSNGPLAGRVAAPVAGMGESASTFAHGVAGMLAGRAAVRRQAHVVVLRSAG